MTAHDHTTYVLGCYRCELGRDEAHSAESDALRGVISALVEAFERGEKLAYTGRLVVTDPDSEASVKMVLDEDDFAVLKGIASGGIQEP